MRTCFAALLMLAAGQTMAGTITVTDAITVEQIGDRIPSETGFGFVSQRPTDNAIGLNSGKITYWLDSGVWVERENFTVSGGGPIPDVNAAFGWTFGADGAEYLADRDNGQVYRQPTEGAGWSLFADLIRGPNEMEFVGADIIALGGTHSVHLGEDVIERIDPAGNVTTVGHHGGAAGFAVVDANTIVMAGGSNEVISQMDLTTGEVQTLFDFGDLGASRFYDIAILPSDDFLVTVHTGFSEQTQTNNSQLWRIDHQTGGVTILADATVQMLQLVWLSDGRLATTAYDYQAVTQGGLQSSLAAALTNPANLSNQAFSGDLATAAGLELTPIAVPEPSTWALLLIGAAGLSTSLRTMHHGWRERSKSSHRSCGSTRHSRCRH